MHDICTKADGLAGDATSGNLEVGQKLASL